MKDAAAASDAEPVVDDGAGRHVRRLRFGRGAQHPDAFAAAQFDAVQMLGHILGEITRTKQPLVPAAVQSRLATEEWKGVVTTYKSDGKGNMAGTLKLVGLGQWRPDDVATALAACDRRAGGPTAPAEGLALVAVEYRDDQ